MIKTIIIGIVVTVIGLFVLSGVQSTVQNNTPPIGNNSNYTDHEGQEVQVSITGEINHPGTYSIGTENTLGDLIFMAGGTTSKADSSAYNESILISTHTSFYIPPKAVLPNQCVEEEILKININTASKDELIEVGFNSTQATSLIAYRVENGDFYALEDIMKVKGIGESTFNKVKNKICLR